MADTSAGGCVSCHAKPGAEGDAQLVLSGGRPLKSDFGTFHVPNISPDETAGTVAPRDERLDLLSPRELEVLGLVARGMSNPEIASQLVVSQHTVHRHVANILAKLGQNSRTGAVTHAISTGLL